MTFEGFVIANLGMYCKTLTLQKLLMLLMSFYAIANIINVNSKIVKLGFCNDIDVQISFESIPIS